MLTERCQYGKADRAHQDALIVPADAFQSGPIVCGPGVIQSIDGPPSRPRLRGPECKASS